MSLEPLSKADVIFWDFDGVIKESSAIKSLAFVEMFSKYGNEVLEKVMEHHQLNGGISREVKIPLYFSKFVGFSLTSQETEDRCLEYSKMVVQKVIDAPWVAGVLDYLKFNSYQQRFVLITGTPYLEIIKILTALDIIDCFQTVYGSPTTKIKALNKEIQSDTDVSKCLFIGDTLTDYEAANAFEVPFMLRETEENIKLFMGYTGLHFNDFQTLNE